jgi:misacylated tRNA(Ala) deacylase
MAFTLYQPYHTDSYLREVDATVTRAEGNRVILDRTVFYARGGGQPADRGTLSWEGGEAQVVDVRHGEDGSWHLLEGPIPEEGARVHGEIDWDRRYALMRAHTALHVLNGVIWLDYGAKVTGVEMEPGKARIDFELERMSGELAQQVEERANDEIAADREVRAYTLPRQEALEDPDLIRSKVNLLPEGIDEVRIVEIVGLDLQADGGTHVARTGEVGRIRITGHKSKGKINKRLRLVIEDREQGGSR